MTGPTALRSVFVYGSLMPGSHNEHVARAAGVPYQAFPARLSAHALYHLEPEGYPAIVPDPQAADVTGWLYTYSPVSWPEALAHLHALEGLQDTPPLYMRVRAMVQLVGGPRAEAWVYIYARPERLARAQRLTGGDWQARGPG